MGNWKAALNHPVLPQEFAGWLSLVGSVSSQGPLGLIIVTLHQWAGSMLQAILRLVA